MAKKKAKTGDAQEAAVDALEGGFDSSLARLEALVGDLEGGELGLEEAMERFAEGVKLLTGCREALIGYESRVKELSAEAEAGLGAFEADEDED
jgi:exodeoxyribonuclease VII small subunit